MKKRYIRCRHSLLAAIALLLMSMGACNKDNDEITGTASMYVPAVAVTKFYLKQNTKVMNHLDSVFFSIDLDNGVIFNADSLPKGTDIHALVPVITYSSTVTEASIEMTDGQHRTGIVDYRKNPGDSIDFTGRVTLTLSSDDISRTYLLKVNVHKADPDSLTWGTTAYAKLPSRMASPRAQKSVADSKHVYSLIEESDGSHTLAVSSDLFNYTWDKQATALPAGVKTETLTLSGDNLYILDGDGNLLKASATDYTWQPTGEIWTGITGDYAGHLLGTALREGRMKHVHYPAGGGIADTAVEEGFPMKGHSTMQAISNSWSSQPTVFIYGGVTADGSLTDAVWAFDGTTWANINNGTLPRLAGASVAPYYNYRKTSTSWIQTEYQVWLLFGGRKADGSLNRTLYVSYDNGVNWKEADSLLQLPESIPSLYGADCIVREIALKSNLSSAWTRMGTPTGSPKRVAYDIDGYNISWACPYLFLIGGEGSDGILSDEVYRGVLERLRFTPLI